MDWNDFQQTLEATQPPPGLTPALESLWWDGKGDWKAAHDRLQDESASDGAWVHAYLHRKEGDLSNAAYWYRRAGRPVADGTLKAEWTAIAQALLGTDW